MTFELLRQTMKKRPVFTPDELHTAGEAAKHEFVQLSNWSRNGKVVRLRKGLYTLTDADRTVPLNVLWLANRLYEPSYVSLEYALSYYGLIPEAIGSITSVSTRKSKAFKTPLGLFRYSSLKTEDFFGFVSVDTPDKQAFWMATPEKAVLDFLHLRLVGRVPVTEDLFLSGFRFQNLDKLNGKVFKETLARFSVRSVEKAAKVFLKILKKG